MQRAVGVALTLMCLSGVAGTHTRGPCQQYVNKNIVNKAAMLQEKSFFSAVSAKGGRAIYTFGGYENIEKVQLKGCEYYSIQEDKWYINEGI